MKKIIISTIFTLFIAGCGGGGGGGHDKTVMTKITTEDIEERAEQLLEADPVFLGSEVLIVHDGGTDRMAAPVCNIAQCTIDSQDTTIEELLSITGFDYVTTHRGVDIGRGNFMHFEGEIHRLGGWLTMSSFSAHAGILTDGEPGSPEFLSENIIHSYSIGTLSGTNPTLGNVTWTGIMVGVDISNTASVGNFVQGDATVTASFSGSATADILFDNITDLSTGRVSPDLEWTGLTLINGGFKDGSIEGRFYGPEHQEVGGIFERSDIIGAFGAALE